MSVIPVVALLVTALIPRGPGRLLQLGRGGSQGIDRPPQRAAERVAAVRQGLRRLAQRHEPVAQPVAARDELPGSTGELTARGFPAFTQRGPCRCA